MSESETNSNSNFLIFNGKQSLEMYIIIYWVIEQYSKKNIVLTKLIICIGIIPMKFILIKYDYKVIFFDGLISKRIRFCRLNTWITKYVSKQILFDELCFYTNTQDKFNSEKIVSEVLLSSQLFSNKIQPLYFILFY